MQNHTSIGGQLKAPLFKGNFTIPTKGLSAQKQSDLMTYCLTNYPHSWAIKADSQNKDSFVLLHVPNPNTRSLASNSDPNWQVIQDLSQRLLSFVWTNEITPVFGNPFQKNIRNQVEHGNSLAPLGVTETTNTQALRNLFIHRSNFKYDFGGTP